MNFRFLAFAPLVVSLAATAVPARADTMPSWNHSADTKMTSQTAFTVAPILPIPLGTLQIAKLSNGARLIQSGTYYDLRDRDGRIVARFDPAGHRTLEDIAHPIEYSVTDTSVVFLGAGHTKLMTLPRPKR